MKQLIEKLTPAILESYKIKVQMADGRNLVVHPHIVVRRKYGEEILKSMLDNGDCLDIPVKKIQGIDILSENFAIDSNCLNFDYDEYELVFPTKADWFELRAGTL